MAILDGFLIATYQVNYRPLGRDDHHNRCNAILEEAMQSGTIVRQYNNKGQEMRNKTNTQNHGSRA
ncbi:hypothetical protein OIHEL45_15124 [Sulfitobacter indolifex HEL-45]|uniref:Uncharacterized protein n=1 Tax=Sulfitobacter indolifex HEL-45 TaxID=391624 RepID=A0ABM9X4E9_9RHOB|nr:hypothetical protein [Sulfitobacter indolifex]EDQ04272.1 hypothetical protein OIHEL45_15124 [Sulfitobacter indolifex HEL-45]